MRKSNKEFLEITPKAQPIKEKKIINFTLAKSKTFLCQRTAKIIKRKVTDW